MNSDCGDDHRKDDGRAPWLLAWKAREDRRLTWRAIVAANWKFSLTCVVLSGFALALHLREPRSAAREGFWPRSTALPDAYRAVSPGQPAVLVFFRTGCEFCLASRPFYEMLRGEAAAAGLEIRFLSIEPLERVITAFEEAGMRDVAITRVPRFEGIDGTPAVVAIDREGRVTASWLGKLDARQERDLRRQVRVMAAQDSSPSTSLALGPAR